MCNCGNTCKCGNGCCKKDAVRERIDRLMDEMSSTTSYPEFEKKRMELMHELDKLGDTKR